MLGELNDIQIENILASQAFGRIACTNGKQAYILPVNYVYDGKYIICQTKDEKKVEIMRNNPKVCFEVDIIATMANCQSVVLSGTFHELKGNPSAKAREYLTNHLWPLLTCSSIHPHEHQVFGDVDDSERVKPIIYRIKIRKKTGTFEKE